MALGPCKILFIVLTLVTGFSLYVLNSSPPICIPQPKAGVPVEPPGTYADESPFFGFLQFNLATLDWFNKRLEWFKGATVFRCHPGLKAVSFSDATSFRYLTTADTTEINRENSLAFGTASTPLRGASLPLATSRDEDHAARRSLYLHLFDQRGMDNLFDAIQVAVKDSVQEWQQQLQSGKTVGWTQGINRLVAQIGAQWLFGTRLSNSDFDQIGPTVILGLRGDDWLTALFGKLGDKSSNQKTQGHVRNIVTLLKESPVWKNVIEKHHLSYGVPSSDVELDFFCTLFINSIGALFLSQQAVLPFLNAHPTVRQKIRDELKQLGEPLTYQNIHKLPYLDAVAHEFQRAAPQPTIGWREAMTDFVVPTTAGPKYQVRKGERLVTHTLMAMRDKKIFGEDVDEVKPHRFLKYPNLKEWVNFFFLSNSVEDGSVKKNPYDCAAALGPGAGATKGVGMNGTALFGDGKGGYAMVAYKYLIAVFADLIDVEFKSEVGWSSAMMVQSKQPSYLSWIPFALWSTKIAPLNIKTAEYRTYRGGTSGTWKVPHSLSGKGTLRVTVIGGKHLINKNILPELFSVNSVVELQVWNQIERTHTAIGTSPRWNKEFTLHPYVYDGKFADVLFVRVYHKRMYPLSGPLDTIGAAGFLHEELGRGYVTLYNGDAAKGEHTIRLLEGGAYITIRIEHLDTTLQVK